MGLWDCNILFLINLPPTGSSIYLCFLAELTITMRVASNFLIPSFLLHSSVGVPLRGKASSSPYLLILLFISVSVHGFWKLLFVDIVNGHWMDILICYCNYLFWYVNYSSLASGSTFQLSSFFKRFRAQGDDPGPSLPAFTSVVRTSPVLSQPAHVLLSSLGLQHPDTAYCWGPSYSGRERGGKIGK